MHVIIAYTHIGKRKATGRQVFGKEKMDKVALEEALAKAGFSRDSFGEGWTKGFSTATIFEIKDVNLLDSYK